MSAPALKCRGPSILNFVPVTASFFAHVLWINYDPNGTLLLTETEIERYPVVGWATIRTTDLHAGDTITTITAMVQCQEASGAELIAATDPIAWAVNEALIGVYPERAEPPDHAVDCARQIVMDRAAREQAGPDGQLSTANALPLPPNSGRIIDSWTRETPHDERATSLGWSPPFSPAQESILTAPEAAARVRKRQP